MGLVVQGMQLGQQLALGEGQFDLRLLAQQGSLFQFAAIRPPVPHRQLQRGGGGVSQVAHRHLRSWIELARGEMIGVDAIKIIQSDRRQEARPGHAHFLPRFLQGAQRGPQFGILAGGRSLSFAKRRQRLGSLQIIHHAEVLVEIRENQHGKFQPAAVHLELCFLQVALLLLKLNLGLDHIRVRHFAALFELLADIEKTPALGQGALRSIVLSLRHDEVVIGLHYGDNQAASRDFRTRPRHSLPRRACGGNPRCPAAKCPGEHCPG